MIEWIFYLFQAWLNMYYKVLPLFRQSLNLCHCYSKCLGISHDTHERYPDSYYKKIQIAEPSRKVYFHDPKHDKTCRCWLKQNVNSSPIFYEYFNFRNVPLTTLSLCINPDLWHPDSPHKMLQPA